MSAALLSELRDRHIELWTEGGKLRFRGSREALTPELRERMRRHKAALLAALHQPEAMHPGADVQGKARAIAEHALRRTGVNADDVMRHLAPEDLDDIASGHMQPINIVAFARSLRDQGELAASTARERIEALPLADKLRIYGKPWPLEINGRVVCWLVADDEAAEACNKAEPVYTAAEVQHMAKLPAEDVREIHELKSRFGGTVMNAEFSESAPSATDKTDNEVTA